MVNWATPSESVVVKPRRKVLSRLDSSLMSPLPLATTPEYTPVELQCHMSQVSSGMGSQLSTSMNCASRMSSTPACDSRMS